jgi:hypothetical protein
METLRNWGTECVGYTERTSVGNNECSSVCLHSVVLVLVHLWLWWQSVWKNREMGDLSDFERGQVVGARLTRASPTKTATLLGISRATVSEVMSADTNHGKTTSAKKNSGRKSALTEADRRTSRRTVSKTQLLQHRWQQNWPPKSCLHIIPVLTSPVHNFT